MRKINYTMIDKALNKYRKKEQLREDVIAKAIVEHERQKDLISKGICPFCGRYMGKSFLNWFLIWGDEYKCKNCGFRKTVGFNLGVI